MSPVNQGFYSQLVAQASFIEPLLIDFIDNEILKCLDGECQTLLKCAQLCSKAGTLKLLDRNSLIRIDNPS